METITVYNIISDDWEVLYINGVLELENHKLDHKDILSRTLNKNCAYYEYYLEESDPWGPFGWSAPKELDNLFKVYPQIKQEACLVSNEK